MSTEFSLAATHTVMPSSISTPMFGYIGCLEVMMRHQLPDSSSCLQHGGWVVGLNHIFFTDNGRKAIGK
jgi:hypothetical protein